MDIYKRPKRGQQLKVETSLRGASVKRLKTREISWQSNTWATWRFASLITAWRTRDLTWRDGSTRVKFKVYKAKRSEYIFPLKPEVSSVHRVFILNLMSPISHSKRLLSWDKRLFARLRGASLLPEFKEAWYPINSHAKIMIDMRYYTVHVNHKFWEFCGLFN